MFEIEIQPKIFFSNGRYPQYSFELNDLNYFKWRMTSKNILQLKEIKTVVVAPLYSGWPSLQLNSRSFSSKSRITLPV